MPASPASTYQTVNAFPGVALTLPTAIATPPGETNRLFILEWNGQIVVITNLASPTRTVFMDIRPRVTFGSENGLLGMAFHPNYANNGYFYLFYSTTLAGGSHQRVSRFQVSSANRNAGLPDSELPLITQFDQESNHNGGDMHFGPDGYLYISVGDGGGQDDRLNNSQRIDKDFFSGILRIDVDKRPGNRAPNPHPALMGKTNYFVPADNPFINATHFNGRALTGTVRTEFWAVGLRNPWRFSFDSQTGTLYAGDVGGFWEEVNVITKGGNYGWAYDDGTWDGPKSSQAPAGFTSVPPIAAYQHGNASNQGNCITGGRVYRGTQIPSLFGKYVFIDYANGNIWALQPNGTNTVPFQRLTSDPGVVEVDADPRNGDLLFVKMDAGQIKRLVSAVNPGSFPASLRDTGAFSDVTTLTPANGIVPYDVNLPFWSDHALKTRWFSVPNTNLSIGFSATGNWSFPTGTVWIKHFELELTNGVPASRKRIETRFLVRNADGVYGLTYRWGDSKTNATLVPEQGMDEVFTIREGGVNRTQTWRYPSRGECIQCHSSVGGLALGFRSVQMNRSFNYAGHVTNQIHALSDAGYFQTRVSDISTLVPLAHTTNTAYSVEHRVRSYLQANCAHCHQPGGTGQGQWDGRITTPTSQAGLIDGMLVNDWGNAQNRVIKPGSVANSMLHTRLATLGAGRMPPLGSSVVDNDSAALLRFWITNTLVAPSSNVPPSVALTSPANNAVFTAPATLVLQAAASDSDGNVTQVEFLNGTNSLGVDTSNPYSVTWSSVPAGVYSLRARATDNHGGLSSSSPISITVSNATTNGGPTGPFVEIIRPANNAVFTAPASFVVEARAWDTDGSIAHVRFFRDQTLLTYDSDEPYSIDANGLGPGTYTFSASATDNQFNRITNAIRITVNAPPGASNLPPTVALTQPANNAVFTAPANVVMQATASDSDGAISRVEFFNGTNSLGVDTASPYSLTWSNAPVGSHSLAARATDNQGALRWSSAVNIVVSNAAPGAPHVEIIRPANNAVFTAPANFVIEARAWDVDGSVVHVRFFRDQTLLTYDSSDPYYINVAGLGPGTYSFSASATDNSFLRSTNTISIRVNASSFNLTNISEVVIESVSATATSIRVRFRGRLSHPYRIQICDELSLSEWRDLDPQPTLTESNGNYEFSDNITTGSRRFYRVAADQ